MKIKKNVKLNYNNKYLENKERNNRFLINFIGVLESFVSENKDFLKNYFEANHGD